MKLLVALALASVCMEAAGGDAKALCDRQAARGGNADAARRLEEIFQRTVSQPRKPLIGDFPTPLERERDRGIKR